MKNYVSKVEELVLDDPRIMEDSKEVRWGPFKIFC